MTTRPEQVAVALLRRCAALLPEDRRAWLEALIAESHQAPSGWPTASWLAGGVWLAVRASVAGRGLRVALFACGALALAWAGWRGPAAPEVVDNRVVILAVLLSLAVIPVFVARVFGPVRQGILPRLVRVVGYTALLVTVGARAMKGEFHAARFAPFGLASATPVAYLLLALLLVLLVAGYATGVLVITAERGPVASSSLVVAVLSGTAVALLVDALQPFGNPFTDRGQGYDAAVTGGWWLALAVMPLAVGAMAAARLRRAGGVDDVPYYGGALAGVVATGTFALLLNVLVGVGVAAFPSRVPLQEPRPGCEDCAATHTVIPASYRGGYWVDISVKQATYAANLVLLVGPVAGFALGLSGAGVTSVVRPRRRVVATDAVDVRPS